MKKEKFPGFEKCMEMMRKGRGISEDGFHCLLAHAHEYVPELIAEFGKPVNVGLESWLLELIGAAKSPEACSFLTAQLRSDDPYNRSAAIKGLKSLDTKEARTILWQARSITFDSPEETERFRMDLD